MKKVCLILLLLSSVVLHAQNKASIDTRWMIDHGWQTNGQSHSSAKIDTNNGPTTIEMLAKVALEFRAEELTKYGIVIGSRIGNIITLRLTPRQIQYLDACNHVLYYQISHSVSPECDNSRADTRVDSVHDGIGLPQSFDGEGVIIGITDWGFDYKHANYNGGGTDNRRILRAWDQFRLAGPAPEGFTYGTELVGYSELKNAQCDTSNIYAYGTHGTHVAGIAAGRGINGIKYTGMAPKANLLLCSFQLGESPWMDAVAWMKRVADEEGKRLVINSSWGMYSFSTLDGNSLVSQAIDSYADSGVVFVTSAGNNGDVKFHIGHEFENDTVRTVVQSYTGGPGNILILWGEVGHNFKAAVGVEQNGTLTMGPFINTNSIGYSLDTFLVINNDTAYYNFIWESENPLNQCPHMDISVFGKAGVTWHLFITADDGRIHAWNLNIQTNHAGNIGYPFLSQGLPGYTNGDAEYGISEPGCARKAITVAAHQSDLYNLATEQLQIGSIASFSSHGPIMGGMRKPEISAPGVDVVSSLSSYTTETGYTIIDNAIAGGRSYPFTRMSGTSMSSPTVSGIVALILQANPHLTTDQVREIIFESARNDSETGNIIASGEISDIWGWGKINAYHAILLALERLGIDEQNKKQITPTVFPNPATQQITLRTGQLQPSHVSIYSIDGRKIWEGTANSESVLNIGEWNRGVYVVNVENNRHVQSIKFVKQ